MPTEEAMQKYITVVDELFPNWSMGSSTVILLCPLVLFVFCYLGSHHCIGLFYSLLYMIPEKKNTAQFVLVGIPSLYWLI
jgi:hypothetical protein